MIIWVAHRLYIGTKSAVLKRKFKILLDNLHLTKFENVDIAKAEGKGLLLLSSFLPSLIKLAPFITNKLALHKVKISCNQLKKLVNSLNLASSLSFHS